MEELKNQEITDLLNKWDMGDRSVENRLIELVRPLLHGFATKLLRQNRSSQLQPTELINELYIRLSESERSKAWESRGHFMGIAARLMRLILTDEYRAKTRQKRFGGNGMLTLDSGIADLKASEMTVLELDDALVKLENIRPRAVRVVEMKYFCGFSHDEIAEYLGISVPTVGRDWTLARSILKMYFDEQRQNAIKGSKVGS